MENKTLVSIIIPTYRASLKTLKRSLNSAINQTYPYIEIIVVDDNGKESDYREKTNEFMKKYKDNESIKYIKRKHNKNGAAARNTGIRHSKGDYIAFLDDDDEFLPPKIELQVKELKKMDDGWEGIYCGHQIIKTDSRIKKRNLREGNIKRKIFLMQQSICAGSTLLIKKEVVDELNGFDESFERHQDFEFLIRYFRKYKLAALNRILVNIYRDERRNCPNANILEQVKLNYLKKFKKDIEEYPKRVQQNIYVLHYLIISKAYLRECNVHKGILFYKKARNHSKIRIKEKIKIFFHLVDGYFHILEKIGYDI